MFGPVMVAKTARAPDRSVDPTPIDVPAAPLERRRRPDTITDSIAQIGMPAWHLGHVMCGGLNGPADRARRFGSTSAYTETPRSGRRDPRLSPDIHPSFKSNGDRVPREVRSTQE